MVASAAVLRKPFLGYWLGRATALGFRAPMLVGVAPIAIVVIWIAWRHMRDDPGREGDDRAVPAL